MVSIWPRFRAAANRRMHQPAAGNPGAKAELLFEQQQLKLSIPQAALKRRARGYVPPEQWDSGIPALLSNYTLRGANDRNRQGR